MLGVSKSDNKLNYRVKDSVHRCPPLETQTINSANWIMEPIASTYRRYLISSGALLLIQSHLPVLCSMILLILTNVFVAAIDFIYLFIFPLVVDSTKRIRSTPNRSFIFLLHCRNRRRSAPFVMLPQSSYFGEGGWGVRGMQPCGTSPLAERCTCLSSPRAAGLMTNTWTLHMEGWLQVNTPSMVDEI